MSSSASAEVESEEQKTKTQKKGALVIDEALDALLPSAESGTGAPDAGAASFRKRRRRKKGVSGESRPAAAIAPTPSAATAVSTPVICAEEPPLEEQVEDMGTVQFVQRSRRRPKGLSFHNSLKAPTELAIAGPAAGEGGQDAGGGGGGGGGGRASDVGSLAFREEEASEKSTQDVYMEAYIEERLRKARLEKGASSGPAAADTMSAHMARQEADAQTRRHAKAAEDELYLNSRKSGLELKAQSAEDGMEEAGERWLTGIQEVVLPVSEKMRNIEATERAKQALRDKQAKDRASGRKPALPANMAVNFKQHQREYVGRIRERISAARGGAGGAAGAAGAAAAGGGGEGGTGKKSGEHVGQKRHRAAASDDRAMGRFMRNQRFRRN